MGNKEKQFHFLHFSLIRLKMVDLFRKWNGQLWQSIYWHKHHVRLRLFVFGPWWTSDWLLGKFGCSWYWTTHYEINQIKVAAPKNSIQCMDSFRRTCSYTPQSRLTGRDISLSNSNNFSVKSCFFSLTNELQRSTVWKIKSFYL